MINEDAGQKLARMLEKARSLLARADHPNTPKQEADLSRQQAARLIEKYRLEEQDLMESGQLSFIVGFREMELCDSASDYTEHYYSLAASVARYLDLELVYNWKGGKLVVEIFGFESDLAIADLLVTECVSQFGRNLEPKYDPEESHEANAWRLRAGGWERHRIATALFGRQETTNDQKAANRRVTKLIRQHAERNGLEADDLLGRGNSISAYRLSFALSFLQVIRRRLTVMQRERSDHGSIVFADRHERIREALYERYPERRPTTKTSPETGRRATHEACARCKAAKSGYCREHAHLRPRKYRGGSVSWSAAGVERGRAAAEGVNLGGATERIGS